MSTDPKAPSDPGSTSASTYWTHNERSGECAPARRSVRRRRDPRRRRSRTVAFGTGQPKETWPLQEIVIHGWDLAAATGQTAEVDAAETETFTRFVSRSTAPRLGSILGPVVQLAGNPSAFELPALAGRKPAWHPGPRTTFRASPPSWTERRRRWIRHRRQLVPPSRRRGCCRVISSAGADELDIAPPLRLLVLPRCPEPPGDMGSLPCQVCELLRQRLRSMSCDILPRCTYSTSWLCRGRGYTTRICSPQTSGRAWRSTGGGLGRRWWRTRCSQERGT